MISKYDPDSIRYFLTMNAPENRDTDFSWREFIFSHNSELLGAYGNFVNRTLKFIEKAYNGKVPNDNVDEQIRNHTISLYAKAGKLIENGHFKQSLEHIFDYIRAANRYFDEQQPWIQVKDSPTKCKNTMSTCVYIISNLAQLLQPFLPFSTESIRNMLGISTVEWKEQSKIPNVIIFISPLFERLDVSLIEEEFNNLVKASNK